MKHAPEKKKKKNNLRVNPRVGPLLHLNNLGTVEVRAKDYVLPAPHPTVPVRVQLRD